MLVFTRSVICASRELIIHVAMVQSYTTPDHVQFYQQRTVRKTYLRRVFLLPVTGCCLCVSRYKIQSIRTHVHFEWQRFSLFLLIIVSAGLCLSYWNSVLKKWLLLHFQATPTLPVSQICSIYVAYTTQHIMFEQRNLFHCDQSVNKTITDRCAEVTGLQTYRRD